MPDRRYTLPRTHRLGGRVAFREVFDAGCRASRGPLTVYVRRNELPHPRLGLSVSRRVGTAVRRNRIKRLVREAFRHLQHDLPAPYDFVVVIRPHEPLALADYQRLLSALLVRADAQWTRTSPKAGPPRGPGPEHS